MQCPSRWHHYRHDYQGDVDRIRKDKDNGLADSFKCSRGTEELGRGGRTGKREERDTFRSRYVNRDTDTKATQGKYSMEERGKEYEDKRQQQRVRRRETRGSQAAKYTNSLRSVYARFMRRPR